MLDIRALKAAMVLNGYNNKTLSNEIGISSRTFTNRLKNGNFRVDEIVIITAKLKLKNASKIFLSDK